ncbi:MAG: TonB-dependent receptor [Proteobacteria bacterium]|nr:TonB-dependent receptor [Pseudomonadota bacterium]
MTLLRSQPFDALAWTVLVTWLSSGVARAQQSAHAEPATSSGEAAPASGDSGAKAEQIEVRGIRGSIEAALTKKRNADAIVDAISAEDVGKFPDENIAESLQRVPGVSITRGFGEGQDVSIRGLGRGRNLTLLNGQGLASSDFFLENFEFNRGFNYAMLPSDLVASVEIYKSPQARLQEGGIGGTIILNTRRPLDQSKSLDVAGSLALGYSDLSNALDPRATLLAGWKSDDGKLGLSLAGVHQQRTLRRDAVEVLSYKRGNIDIGGDGIVDGLNVFYPAFVGSAFFQQKRVRDSVLGTAQWKPIPGLDFTLNGLYSRLAGNNTNDNYLANGLDSFVGAPGSDPMNPFAVNVVNNAIIQGDTAVFIDMREGPKQNGMPHKEIQLDTFKREVALKTYSLDLESTLFVGSWTLSNHTGITQATGGRGEVQLLTFLGDAAYSIDLQDGVGAVSFAGIDPTNPAALDTFNTWRDNISGTQQQIYSQVDGTLQLENPVVRSVQVGARYRTQFQDRSRRVGNLVGPAPFMSLAQYPSILTTPDDYLNGIAKQNTLRRYVKPDPELGWDTLAPSLYTFADDPTFFFKVSEQVVAAYAQGNVDWDIGYRRLRGNLGLRVVNTQTTSRSRSARGDTAVGMDSVEKTGDTRLLPSLNLALDATEDVVVRAALARVMNRPGFTQLSPAVHCHETIPECTGGNPDLDPFVADQLDLSGEWYFDRGSALLLGGFYKRIHSFVGLAAMPESLPGIPNASVTRPFNGEGGNTYGFEAAFQHTFTVLPKPLDGLGLIANYVRPEHDHDDGPPVERGAADTGPVAAQSQRGGVLRSEAGERPLRIQLPDQVLRTDPQRRRALHRRLRAAGRQIHRGPHGQRIAVRGGIESHQHDTGEVHRQQDQTVSEPENRSPGVCRRPRTLLSSCPEWRQSGFRPGPGSN